jgi:hypothetical protein
LVRTHVMAATQNKIMLDVPSTGPVGSYRRGDTIEASVFCIRNRFLVYSPLALHAPLPYRGTRFSIVFFVSNLYKGNSPAAFTSEKVRTHLVCGFPGDGLAALGFLGGSSQPGLSGPSPSNLTDSETKRPKSAKRKSRSTSRDHA